MGKLQTCSFLSIGCWAAGFHRHQPSETTTFQAHNGAVEREMGIKQVKTSQRLPFSLCFSHFFFFLNQHSSDSCKPLVNFQSHEKVDFDHFCHHCLCFYEEGYFLKSLLCIPEVLPPTCLYTENFIGTQLCPLICMLSILLSYYDGKAEQLQQKLYGLQSLNTM